MNAVAKIEDQENLPGIPSQVPSMMEMVLRAARDPGVDVSKMERLMLMAKELRAEEARTAYYADLAEMQDELPSIKERGEIKIGNGPGQKYALWEDINTAIKPIMKRHGFAISFRTGIDDGKITVTGVLSHKAGHSEETTIHLPSDTSGSKNAVQAVGSSTSYGKRYTASALLNLTSGGEDDDGRAAGGNGPISDEQLAEINGLMTQADADPEKFCKYMGVTALKFMTAKDMPRAREALNLAINQLQQKRSKAPK